MEFEKWVLLNMICRAVINFKAPASSRTQVCRHENLHERSLLPILNNNILKEQLRRQSSSDFVSNFYEIAEEERYVTTKY